MVSVFSPSGANYKPLTCEAHLFNIMENFTISKFGIIWLNGKLLTQYGNGNGYLFISVNGGQYYVHRLVAFKFIPNPENKPQVNHKNGIKWDNFYLNLEWNTASENGKHAYKNGLNHVSEYQKEQTSKACSGSSNIHARLTEKDIPVIKEMKSLGMTNKAIANIFNVNRETIGYIIREKTWKHVLDKK